MIKPQPVNALGSYPPVIDSAYLALATTTRIFTNYNSDLNGCYFWISPEFNGYAAQRHSMQFLLVVPD